jgi:membrane dipeptidase
MDLEAARDAGFAGGFFALYVPSPHPDDVKEIPYALPLPDPIPHDEAARVARELYDTLCELPVRRATSVDDFGDGEITAIVHFEGAEALAPDLSDLEGWYERGLRSVGLVWSRPNAFAEGVPFVFPGTPDTGPGLTAAGQALVRRCNELGVLVDLAHLTEAGFRDVARLSDAPLVVTHAGAHALCPIPRSLSDGQLDLVRESGGVVGVVFDTPMTRADGDLVADTPLDVIAAHLEHMAERMGGDHVALGSDFDGAHPPAALGDASRMQRLLELLRARGWSDGELARLAHGNWLRVLRATWR